MQQATVAVGVATLWTTQQASRAIDAAALGSPAHPRRWLDAMTHQERIDLHRRTLTQVRLGECVLVEDIHDDWTKIIVPSQPTRRDDRGYPGWLPSAQLINGAATEPSYVVDATSIALRDEPNGDVVLPAVVLGTRLAAAGPAQRGWMPLQIPAMNEPLWCRMREVVPISQERDVAPLAIAERLRDAPYLWGGLSAYGIDCSGLVYLAHHRAGRRLPRSIEDQYATATPVPLGEERPGDVYFFAHNDRPVHHVGFVAGDGKMLHACPTIGRVVCEPLNAEQHTTMVGAARL